MRDNVTGKLGRVIFQAGEVPSRSFQAGEDCPNYPDINGLNGLGF